MANDPKQPHGLTPPRRPAAPHDPSKPAGRDQPGSGQLGDEVEAPPEVREGRELAEPEIETGRAAPAPRVDEIVGAAPGPARIVDEEIDHAGLDEEPDLDEKRSGSS